MEVAAAAAATEHATAAAAFESKLELQRTEFHGEAARAQQEWRIQHEELTSRFAAARLKHEADLKAARAAGKRAVEETKTAHALTVSQATLAWEERAAQRQKELAEAKFVHTRELGEHAQVRNIVFDIRSILPHVL